MASKQTRPINSTTQPLPASFGPNIISYTTDGAKKGASAMTNPLPQKNKVKGKS